MNEITGSFINPFKLHHSKKKERRIRFTRLENICSTSSWKLSRSDLPCSLRERMCPFLPSRSLFSEPISNGANSKTIVSRKKIILELSCFEIHWSTPFLHRNRPKNRLELLQPLQFYSTNPFPRDFKRRLRFILYNFFLTLFNFWEIFPLRKWRSGEMKSSRNSEINLKKIVRKLYSEHFYASLTMLERIRYLSCSLWRSFTWKETHRGFRHDDTY